MKIDFSYFCSINNILLIIIGVFFSTGCGFKTIVHPYPQEVEKKINSYKNKITLHKDEKLKYLPDGNVPDSLIDLNYKEGSLYVDTGWSYRLKKEDQFSDPFTKSAFTVTSEAYFDEQSRENVFKVNVLNKKNPEYGYLVTGTSQNSTVLRSDSAVFQIIAEDLWSPSIKKLKTENGNEWHHYPLGGTWEYFDEMGEQYLVAQGSPVGKKLGSKANYGESFTLLSNEELSKKFKSEFILVFLGYWHLTNIQYYYEECDFENISSDGCPGSVIIK